MESTCCPLFDPDRWHNKTITWTEEKFAKDRVFTLLFMPIGFGRTMRRLAAKIEAVHAESPDWLCLSDHTSRWNMDVYLAVDRDLPDTEMVTLPGRYLSRVYEGPFSDTGRWCQDFAEQARREGVETDRLLHWYTTCPKCAKERGKNYVVLLGRAKA